MNGVLVPRPVSLPDPAAQLVVVEASAGTGKTFFLEHRVVDLILGAGAQLDQILLVTFTEKAVAELRLRIRDLLDRLARTGEDAARLAAGTPGGRDGDPDPERDGVREGDRDRHDRERVPDAPSLDELLGGGVLDLDLDPRALEAAFGPPDAGAPAALEPDPGPPDDARLAALEAELGAPDDDRLATLEAPHDPDIPHNAVAGTEPVWATRVSIDGASWVIDEPARRRLRAAVTAFDHAPIFTIHGFCHRILIEDAFAAHRLFDQTQVADEVAFDAAFGSLLRERFARVDPERELLGAYLAADRTVDDLRGLLLACVRAGRDAKVRRLLEPETVRSALRRLHAVVGSERQRAHIMASLPKHGNERRWIEPWVRGIGEALERADLDAPAPGLLAVLDAQREAIGKLIPYAVASPAHGDLAAALRGVASTLSLDEAIAAELLPQLMERIGQDKAEQGQYDYDDMLQLVWQALTGPRASELAGRLRERTPWAMIDEFQDTDPVQWNIFRTVWMTASTRGLTIVGDPKQAIYGFRGADVTTYLAARDEMLRAGATRVALDVNRRSTEPLVAAVNQILVGNFGMPLLDGKITYDEPVKASGDIACDDLRPPVVAFALRSSGKSTADPNRAALATAIGDAIEALRRAPPTWSSRGKEQPFALDQVMVLTRANRDSTEIAATLRARGLPCALVEPEKLFATREAAELAAVLAAIAAPRDRSARLRALHTRYFDVPWAELVHVVDAPDHHPLISRIFDWSQLAARRAYETLFRRVVEASHYAERALVLGGGERALTNTWHLVELLLAEVSRSRSDLSELVVQLRRWIADDASNPDERDIQRAETDADAIRVLTIHKAKGLEAPYVFVYGGIAAAPRSHIHTLHDAFGRAIFVGKEQDPETKQRIENETNAENQRLAYVALTRAQVRLYLPIYECALSATAAYHPIQRCLLPQAARTTGRKLFETVVVPIGAPEVEPAPDDALASFVAASPPITAELVPLPAARRGLAMVSYTRLARDLEAAAVGAKPRRGASVLDMGASPQEIDPAEFDTDYAPTESRAAVLATATSAGATGGATASSAKTARGRAKSITQERPPVELAPGELPPGADAGLLLHDVLEVADLAHARAHRDLASWAADPTVTAQLADAARARGIAPVYLPHATKLVHDTLVKPLRLVDGSTLPALVDAPLLARETEFAYPLPGTQPGLVRGFIDALVAWDDELWVLDYKSDLLVGDDLAAEARTRVTEQYTIQARLYAIAADRMRGHRRLGGLLYQFLRHDLVVAIRADDEAIAAWTDWLARLPIGELEPRGRA